MAVDSTRSRTTAERAAAVLAEAIGVCRAHSRPDLERTLRLAGARLERPETVVCVVGEFKQGKSSLINALLGEEPCPVDDDLATSAITVLAYGEVPAATVHRVEHGERIVEPIAVEDVREYASEHGNPENRLRVELVEIELPNPVLAHGLTLVDTPGIGGFRTSYRAAVLSFLPAVDGVIFVSDASAELTAPELDFLFQARERVPAVLFALTKADLYPEWRRIADLDRAHLISAGMTGEVFPVSSLMRFWAIEHGEPAVNIESGFTRFLEAVREHVIDRAGELAASRARDDARRALDQIGETLRAELEALDDPNEREHVLARLDRAEARLRELREAGARWMVTLADGFTDLRTQSDYRLRSAIRARLRDAESELDAVDPAGDWDAFLDRLQARLADEINGCFEYVHEGAVQIRDRIAAMLNEEDLSPLPVVADAAALDLTAMQSVLTTGGAPRPRRTLDVGLGALRGVQGGGFMVAWLGGVIGVALSAPLTLGLGAVLGAKYLIDERKRQLDRRRHEAKAAVRRFLDELQLEAANRTNQSLLVLQRQLRDHFQSEIQQLLATYADAARSIRESLQLGEHQRAKRVEELRANLLRFDEVRTRAAMAEPVSE